MEILGLGEPFFEPLDDNVPTYEDHLRNASDIKSEEEPIAEDPLLIAEGAVAGADEQMVD